VPPLEVVVVDGPDAGKSQRAAERVVVGTHPSASLVLTDGAVSRFHCEIAIDRERVLIRDLESRNGTLVNGVSILHAHLAQGALIDIGRSKLRFGLGTQPVRVPVTERAAFGALVGQSLGMRQVFALFERAAQTDATVLLTGETGTGKELAAESIHGASARCGGPFVILDCAAIPRELMESELFGHERGAFTGAVASRVGAFEAAHGGTIFLDEIGELDLELQPKLLRALERRQIKRVGGQRYLPVDVRVIAATNRSLQMEVNSRRFRPDLYFRLAVLEVRLPALRERPEDVPILVENLLHALGAAHRPEAQLLRAPEALADLARHPWPGNVRELRNYVERCLALAQRQPLAADGTAQSTGGADLPPDSLRSARERALLEFERQYLEALLAHHGGNVSAAARTAGVDRKYLYRLLWRNGLR
jgi:DNA-binding NtrC family response regulator